MPHKVGKNKWKWGNIERSSKGDLAKTVYGIWRKNGGKGDFGTFWRTGKTSSKSRKKDESYNTLRPLDFRINKAIMDSYASIYSPKRRSLNEEFDFFALKNKVGRRLERGADRIKEKVKSKVDTEAIKQKVRDARQISRDGWEGFKEGLNVGARRTGAEIAKGFERLGSGAARLVGKGELADEWDSKTDKYVDDTYDRYNLGYEDTLTDLGRVGGSIAGTALPMAAVAWAGDTALKGAGGAVRNLRDMKDIKSLSGVPSKTVGALPKPLQSPYDKLTAAEKAMIDKGKRLYAKALEREAAEAAKQFGTPWSRAKDLVGKMGTAAAGTLGGAAAGYSAAKMGDSEQESSNES